MNLARSIAMALGARVLPLQAAAASVGGDTLRRQLRMGGGGSA